MTDRKYTADEVEAFEEAKRKVAYDGLPAKAQRAFELGWEMRGETIARQFVEQARDLERLREASRWVIHRCEHEAYGVAWKNTAIDKLSEALGPSQ